MGLLNTILSKLPGGAGRKAKSDAQTADRKERNESAKKLFR